MCICIFQTQAYEISASENEKLTQIKSKLWLLKNEKGINWYYQLKNNIDTKLPNTTDKTKSFLLSEIKNEILYIIESYKPQGYDTLEEKYNLDILNQKASFFQEHGKKIVWDLKVKENCIQHYDFVDEIAKRNNFPTALILAVWRKESNCGLFNPYNWRWPFQITSQYHTPGEITLEQMWEKIQAYIDFSKWKIDYFNSNKSYAERFWNEKIDFEYDSYTLKDIQLYAILYNGITKTTDIESSKFANGNLSANLKSDTDGIATLFLKILNWQVENNK